MQKRLIKGVMALSLLLAFNKAQSQIDAHFTEYYANPLWLNPALTGVSESDARISGMYRTQWYQMGEAIKSKSMFFDYNANGSFSFGANLINQSSVNGSYNYYNGGLNGSYQFNISRYDMLSFGFQGAFINRYIDPSKLTFGNQFNPIIGYDPTLPSNEIFNQKSSFTLDLGAGLFYYNINPNALINPFAGAAMFHINKPADDFLTNSSAVIPYRYTFNGGARINISDQSFLTESLVYILQGNAEELAIASYYTRNIIDDNDFIAGFSYRWKSAATVNLGLKINNVLVGAAYDFNAAAVKDAMHYQGALELTATYLFNRRDKINESRSICPRF